MIPSASLILATWFGSGYLKPASGTWGSLATLPFLYLIAYWGGFYLTIICIIILFYPSVIAAKNTDRHYNSHDNGCIVIDEVLGMMVTACFVMPLSLENNVFQSYLLSWQEILLIFIAFRFFDIVKPPPIKQIDQQWHNEYGVIIDDIVAGLYAGITCLVIKQTGLLS